MEVPTVKNYLPKSISKSNIRKSEHLKKKLQDYITAHQNRPFTIGEMASFTLRLPDFSREEQALHDLLKEKLIDFGTKTDLEEAKVINFCRTIQTLYPLKTAGDGSCLVHAVSMAIWGVHDEAMLLRRLIYVSLVEDSNRTFYKRWKIERERLNKEVPQGYNLSKQQWRSEWDMVVQYAEDQKQTAHKNQLPFESLEEIHIFVLANVIQRPIIVVSESVVKSLHGSVLGPNNFAGIYLPLLWDATKCTRTPVVLGYHMAHFTPLVNMSQASHHSLTKEYVIPLVNNNLEPLYIHFLSSSEERQANVILQKYLNICEINWMKSDGLILVLSAKLEYDKIPEKYDLLSDFIMVLRETLKQRLSKHEQPSHRQKEGHSMIFSDPEDSCSLYTSTGKENDTHLATDKKPLTTPKHVHAQENTEGLIKQHSSEKMRTSKIYTKPGQQKCIISGCKYAGSIEYGGCCYQCFLEETKNININDLGKVEQPFEHQPSITNVRCQFVQQCKNLASTATFPYCHEHTGGKDSSTRISKERATAIEGWEPSITDFQCHHPGCKYAASTNTFPFCHEHENDKKDMQYMLVTDKSVTPMIHQLKPNKQREFDQVFPHSVSTRLCEHTGCRQCCSEETYPYCHQHSKGIYTSTSSNLSKAVKNITEMEKYAKSENEDVLQEERYPSLRHESKSAPKQCPVPGCKLYGPPVLDYYCVEHFMMEKPLDVSKHCRVCSCNNKANEKYDGLCSECWLTAALREEQVTDVKIEHKQSDIVPKAQMPKCEDELYPEDDLLHFTAHANCIGPYCPNVANPKLGGLCDYCYSTLAQLKQCKKDPSQSENTSSGIPNRDEQTSQIQRKIIGSSKQEHFPKDASENYHLKQDYYPSNTRDDTSSPESLDLMSIEEKVRKMARKCITSDCSNFGSSAKSGYCNSCYCKLRKQ